MFSPTHVAPQPNIKDDLSSEQDSPVSVLVDCGNGALHDVEAFDGIAAGGGDGRLVAPPQTAWQSIAASAWFPHAVLFICQLCFAAMAITSHPALESIPPLVYCTLRIAVALPLLLASARFKEPEFRPRWRDGPWVLALGCAGIAVPQSTIFVGNHLAGAAYTGIFTPTSPVYVALISAAFGIERISVTKGIGISLSVAGALVLVRVDQLDIHKANTLGLLALLTNALSFAVYLCILQQHLARRPFPFSAFLCASLVGGAIIATIAAPEFQQVDWHVIPWSAWAALLWAGWGTSWAAHLGICWAVGRCSAVVPSIYGCLQPLLTVGLAAALLGQLLSGRDFGAMLIILAGVALVIRAKLADNRRRHAERGEYQPVRQVSNAGKLAAADDDGGRPLQRCPSKFFVPGLDSTAHMLARVTAGSSDNLAAQTVPHGRRSPPRLS